MNTRDELRVYDCREQLYNPRHLTAFRHPNGDLGLIAFGGPSGTARLEVSEDSARELLAWLLRAYCDLPAQRAINRVAA